MNLKTRIASLLLCAGLPLGLAAQDTDLFMTNPGATTAAANVLIIVDNTANWSRSQGGQSSYDWVKEALMKTVAGLDVCTAEDQSDCHEDDYMFNIGLMLFTETGSGNDNPSGGYVRYAMQPMNKENKEGLVALVDSLHEQNDRGNAAEFATAMHEAYLYYEGMNAYAGHNKAKRDNKAFVNDTPPLYKGMLDICSSNNVIFVSNGPPSSGEDNTAGKLLKDLGGNTNIIPLTPSGSQSNWADEYARFLRSKGIATYALDVRPQTTGQGPGNTELLKSMARQGGSESNNYFRVETVDALSDAFDNILGKIQSVNSVFAATALPVSVNVRGTFLNEVYMAVFRPHGDAGPRWLGNLKLYQFVVDGSGQLELADANGLGVLNDMGFILDQAVSLWTQPSNYWDFDWEYDIPDKTKLTSDSPDGPWVEKGGSAQRQRLQWQWPSSRNLYTCTASCSGNNLLSGTPFATGNSDITSAALKAADATERGQIIDWVHGLDNLGERNPDEVRPSLHGDVVHSRPAVVNYNRASRTSTPGTEDTDIVVFYGANDGVFRAIRGSKQLPDSGRELWGFVAEEFFGKLKWLRDNEPEINVPSDPDDPEFNKPYFMDGSVSVYVHDDNKDGRIDGPNDKVWMFITMRRGGDFLYALDVTVPESPRFLWKKGPGDTGYGELGETWSEAKVARINHNGTERPVLIMGAGYDPAAQDHRPAGVPTKGRGVLVLDAATGAVIWQAGPSPSGAAHNLTVAGMTENFAADLTVIDRNRNGFADRIYAADTGANVWRIDIADQDPDNWAVHKLAELGGTGSDARKFLFPADVVYARDVNGPYDAVLIGSGDREKPFDADILDHFYMLKDRDVGDTGGSATIVLDHLYDATDNLIQKGSAEVQEAELVKLADATGWFIRLENSGEKLIGGAVTLAGTVFFATNQPSDMNPNTCGTLGIARIYSMDFRTAIGMGSEGLREMESGEGFLPSPTPVVVEIEDEDGNPSKYQTVCFGPTCVTPPNVVLEQRQKVYWHKAID